MPDHDRRGLGSSKWPGIGFVHVAQNGTRVAWFGYNSDGSMVRGVAPLNSNTAILTIVVPEPYGGTMTLSTPNASGSPTLKVSTTFPDAAILVTY